MVGVQACIGSATSLAEQKAFSSCIAKALYIRPAKVAPFLNDVDLVVGSVAMFRAVKPVANKYKALRVAVAKTPKRAAGNRVIAGDAAIQVYALNFTRRVVLSCALGMI
jgi:hypothetical protein